MKSDHLIKQAEQLHQRLTIKTNALIDAIGGCSTVPRSYLALVARAEDVRANSFNRFCRRQGKAHYPHFKKSQFQTDGLGLPLVQPSVALGQGGTL